MKTLISLTIFAFLWINVVAQAPQAINYQAVARNSSGQVLANQSVSFRISILSGSATGTTVYTETHTGKTTNQFGLVNLAIGKGTPVTGTLSAVAWDTGTYYIKVEMDPSGGSSYQTLGTSQLLSVPYALNAKNVEQEADGDPTNEIQELQLSGTVLGLTKSSHTVTLPSSGAGDNWGTDFVHTDVTLEGKGTTSAPLKIAGQSASTGQVLKWNGTIWSPAIDEAGGFNLPWSGTATNTTQALKITNMGSGMAISGESAAGSGVFGMTDGTNTSGVFGLAHALSGKNYGVRGENDSPDGYSGYFVGSKFYISNNTGVGIENPTAKLDIDGQIKIRGGSPGGGKVLTSDVSGLASWQIPGLHLPYSGTVSSEDVAFQVTNTGSSGIAIVGKAAATSAYNVGVYGVSNSPDGFGVYGYNSVLSGMTFGIAGKVESSTGFSGFFDGGKFYVSGNVGIGNQYPAAKLDVNGQVKITGGSPGAGKVLTSDANGLATWQTSAGGFQLPYVGDCNSAEAAFAITQNGTGKGIYVYNPGTTGDITGIEVSFKSVTGTGMAAYAQATGGTTNGIMGVTASSNGTGVKGIATHTSGDNFGVFGESKSSEGKAVWGYNTSSTGIGIGICGSVTSFSGYSGFFTGGRFYVNSMVGIGTTEPSQKLHIKGSAPGEALVFIEPNKWNAAGDYGELRFGDANHYIRGEHTTGMTFYDANRFIFKVGNVGIGIDNPAAKLDVSASQGPNLIIRDSDGGSGRPGIQFVNNYIHYISGDDSEDEIFGIYAGYGSTRNFAAKLNVHGPATGNWGKYIGLTHDGNHGRIYTDAGYLIMQPAGQRVGIGTDAPTQSLHVNGTLRVEGMTTGSSVGTVYRTSDGTLITGASDIRLKENIEPLANSLYKIMQLNGVTFSWKADPEKRKNIGFIAQEFEKVFPELVFTNEVDGYKGINYAEVSAVLVEAIKELKAENDRLKAENEKLKIKDLHVESRLDKLEQLVGASAYK